MIIQQVSETCRVSVRTYTWDGANRLVQVVSGTLATQYSYNADGLRVEQSVDGDSTEFVWNPAAGLAQVLATSDGAVYLHGLASLPSSGGDGLQVVGRLPQPIQHLVGAYSKHPGGLANAHPLGQGLQDQQDGLSRNPAAVEDGAVGFHRRLTKDMAAAASLHEHL